MYYLIFEMTNGYRAVLWGLLGDPMLPLIHLLSFKFYFYTVLLSQENREARLTTPNADALRLL